MNLSIHSLLDMPYIYLVVPILIINDFIAYGRASNAWKMAIVAIAVLIEILSQSKKFVQTDLNDFNLAPTLPFAIKINFCL